MLRLVWVAWIGIAASGCLPLLSQETVHSPQPAPMCGDTGRAYQTPQPTVVVPPSQPPVLPSTPAAPPTGAPQ